MCKSLEDLYLGSTCHSGYSMASSTRNKVISWIFQTGKVRACPGRCQCWCVEEPWPLLLTEVTAAIGQHLSPNGIEIAPKGLRLHIEAQRRNLRQDFALVPRAAIASRTDPCPPLRRGICNDSAHTWCCSKARILAIPLQCRLGSSNLALQHMLDIAHWARTRWSDPQ